MYWNHNVAYHPLVLDAVPAGCGTALDVGCGDGLLARKLATRARRVTGLDTDPGMIEAAQEHGGPATFVEGDFLTLDLPDESYGFVCAVATIHHMDFTAAITKMKRLLEPGGRLVVIGLATNRGPLDWAMEVPSVLAHQVLSRVHGMGWPDAPVTNPTMTWGEVRRAALESLPGARFRRRLLWRYSLIWTKPAPTPHPTA